jgi:hypothetical protein
MAILASAGPITVNGTFTSPSVGLPVRFNPGKYVCVITWENPAQMVDPQFSFQVRLERWDGTRWNGLSTPIRGGAGRTNPDCRFGEVVKDQDGNLVDEWEGHLVHLVITSPAPEFPGTVGGVLLSGRVEDA